MRSIDYVDDYAARFRCFGGDGGGGGGGVDPTQGYGNTDDPDDDDPNAGSVSPSEGLGPNDGPAGPAGPSGAGSPTMAPALTVGIHPIDQLQENSIPRGFAPPGLVTGALGLLRNNPSLGLLGAIPGISIGYGLLGQLSPSTQMSMGLNPGPVAGHTGVTTTSIGPDTGPPGPDGTTDGGGPTPLQKFLIKANA